MRLRARDRMYLKSSRIKRLGDPLDISALACGIPSLIGNDHRNFFAVKLIVQFPQTLLIFLQLFFIFLLRQFLIQFYFRKLRCLLKRERILQKRHGKTRVFQCGIDTAHQRLQHLKLRPLFILRVDQIPRCLGRIRVTQILLKHIHALRIVFILPAVILVYTPLCVLVIL